LFYALLDPCANSTDRLGDTDGSFDGKVSTDVISADRTFRP